MLPQSRDEVDRGQRLRQAIDGWWESRPLNEQTRLGAVRAFQRELAPRLTGGKAGTSYNAVLTYINGTSAPSLEWLSEAARLLECRDVWLICGHGASTLELEEQREKDAAAATLTREAWRDRHGLRGDQLRNWLTLRTDPAEWAIEAVMRFDLTLEQSEVWGAPEAGDLEEDRNYLLWAALSFLLAAERGMTFDGGKAGIYGRHSIRMTLVPPGWSRGRYAAWADTILSAFALQVRGLGVDVSLEERRRWTQEMVEVVTEDDSAVGADQAAGHEA